MLCSQEILNEEIIFKDNEISYFHWLLMRLWDLCFHHILFLYFSLIWSFLQTYDEASLWHHHEDEQQHVDSDGDGGDRPHTYTHLHMCARTYTHTHTQCFITVFFSVFGLFFDLRTSQNLLQNVITVESLSVSADLKLHIYSFINIVVTVPTMWRYRRYSFVQRLKKKKVP